MGSAMFPAFLTTDNLVLAAEVIIIVVVALVLDRLIRRSISRYGKKVDMEPHAVNILKLIARIIVAVSAVVAFMGIFNVGADWFLGISALTGTAIGFASTQTIGNFLAGFYIMISGHSWCAIT